MTNNSTPDFTLTGSLLVAQYNEMVATATDLGLEGFKEINRFATSAKGVERTQKLHEAIQAHLASTSNDDASSEVTHSEEPVNEETLAEAIEETMAADAADAVTDPEAVEAAEGTHPWDQGDQSHKAPAEVNHAGIPAVAETETEELTQLPDETEEAFMARKAAKKTKAKAPAKKTGTKGGGTKPRSTNGTTIRERTEEYNEIVRKMTKAQKEAAPWAKHHTSNFESQTKADAAFDRLKAALKNA